MKIDKDLLHILDRWLEYKWQYDRIAGVSVGILSGKKIVYAKGFGYMDKKLKKKTDPHTVYRIASVSKVFTALGILRLAQDGKLKLDDPITKFFPEVKPTAKLKQITVRKFLTHTSMITRDGNLNQWETEKFPTEKALFTQLTDDHIHKAPTVKFKYSNIGYSYLGIIIARVSGSTYEEFMQRLIIKPLGMEHTSSLLNDSIKNKLATGYTSEYPGFKEIQRVHAETYGMASATGFSSNSLDLLQFAGAIINRSRKILNKKFWNIAFKELVFNKDEARNLFMYKEIREKHKTYGHGGSFAGFVTRFSVDIKNKLGIVVLINSNSAPGNSYLNGLYGAIYNYEKFIKRIGKLKGKIKNASRYEGRFGSHWGAYETVAVKGHLIVFGTPTFNPIDFPAILEHIKGDTFRIHDPDGFGSDGELATFKFKNKKLFSVNWSGHEYKII